MPSTTDHHDTGYAFQVDLLNLSLILTQTEKQAEPDTRLQEAALAQIRMLASQH
ncbi:MAG: hypothetical protein HYX27_23685 [Acidobacteria bacterium]|nr:hypothetical protein [Acidobacteriota bacterium]